MKTPSVSAAFAQRKDPSTRVNSPRRGAMWTLDLIIAVAALWAADVPSDEGPLDLKHPGVVCE
jgi:hypothetical protein